MIVIASLIFAGVAITRDGRRVYSASWDETFAAHDVESGRQIFREQQPGKLSHLVLAADERRAWTGSLGGTLRAWALTDDRAAQVGDLLALPDDLSVMCAALTPDGKTLLVGGEDNVLRFIDVGWLGVQHRISTPDCPDERLPRHAELLHQRPEPGSRGSG